MEKIKSIGLYITCVLCGIYTADMIFRFVRYISVFNQDDAFAKTIIFTGTVFLDGSSFMILSAVCAFLIAVSAFVFKLLKKTTAGAFVINLVSCAVFIISVNVKSIDWSTVLYISVITVPLYLISGLWCIYFSIRNLCDYFLNSTKEINK